MTAIKNDVPVLNLAAGGSVAEAARVLGEGFEEFGFVIAVNHGIPSTVLDNCYNIARRAFALPADVKRRYEDATDGHQTGYTPFGVEHARDNPTPDLKEFWHVRKHVAPENYRFPAEIPDFGSTCFDLVDRLDEVARHLLLLIEKHLGLSVGTLVGAVCDGDSLLRLLFYPALLGHERGMRSSPHTDINFITLLVSATGAGLEVQTRDGTWVPVNNPPNAIVVNVGDMLQAFTKGRLRSTPHRVVNGSGKERLSIPYFVHPRPEVLLTREPPLTAGEYLQQRLREIGLR